MMFDEKPDYFTIQTQLNGLKQGVKNLCVQNIHIDKKCFGGAADIKEKQCDNFEVSLNIATCNVKWNLIFDCFDLDSGPDFVFPQNELSEDFDPDYEQVKSLLNWNKNEPNALINVLKDLVEEYKNYQLEQLKKLNLQLYNQVLELMKSFNKVEVFCSKKYHQNKQVTILVEFPMDIVENTISDSNKNWNYSNPMLQINFELKGPTVSNNVYIHLPPHIEKVVNMSLITPATMQGSNDKIALYVTNMQEKCYSYLKLLCESKSRRKKFLKAVHELMKTKVIEYDSTNFFKMSLLYSFEDFNFIVHLSMYKTFPKDAPLLTFESTYYCKEGGKLFQMVCKKYSYDMKWSADDMARKIKQVIEEKAPVFKNNCNTNGVICM